MNQKKKTLVFLVVYSRWCVRDTHTCNSISAEQKWKHVCVCLLLGMNSLRTFRHYFSHLFTSLLLFISIFRLICRTFIFVWEYICAMACASICHAMTDSQTKFSHRCHRRRRQLQSPSYRIRWHRLLYFYLCVKNELMARSPSSSIGSQHLVWMCIELHLLIVLVELVRCVCLCRRCGLFIHFEILFCIISSVRRERLWWRLNGL